MQIFFAKNSAKALSTPKTNEDDTMSLNTLDEGSTSMSRGESGQEADNFRPNMNVTKVVFNALLVCLIFLGIAWHGHSATPQKSGFFCADETLNYPYKNASISELQLGVVGIVLPGIIIPSVQFWATPDIRGLGSPVTARSMAYIISYGFGAAVTMAVTEMGKYTVGRPRPHFKDVCVPVPKSTVRWSLDCGSKTDPKFVTEFRCAGNRKKFPDDVMRAAMIKDASLSYPSGHSSFSFFAATFLSIYLQQHESCLPFTGTLIVPVVQALLFGSAIYTSLTRAREHFHHNSDLLSGGVLGIAVGVAAIMIVAKMLFKYMATGTEEDAALNPIRYCSGGCKRPRPKRSGKCRACCERDEKLAALAALEENGSTEKPPTE
jgi:phosphatidate phosphatase